ncbi:hypothetical protein S7711_11126 [Stachybotrys chartarum IBT 7711]|uniref:Uncharacterized protein n=1 Tax=Stachybotrys chartarum (strain CBS 109288 / IBT 7711) TaxID=1280523 RepID=A0A084BAG8_STACB|nr:hypothetical protein S7711_11126 [Stachybotrys chartarum IBT 7711]
MSVLISPMLPSRARELVRQIWPQLPRKSWQETHYMSLAQHFESQYNELCESSATSIEELFELLYLLKRNVMAPRRMAVENLREELQAQQLPLVRAENLMELLARSWLTMNITINPHPLSFPYQMPMD